MSRSFYEFLGPSFTLEKHGKGHPHYSADIRGVIFELYPLIDEGKPTLGVRLGFEVESLETIKAYLQEHGVEMTISKKEWGLSGTVTDPDGHIIELSEKD